MRLLRAELRKLRRPLVLWLFLTTTALVVLAGWGVQADAKARNVGNPAAVSFGRTSCESFGLSEGPQCEQAKCIQIGQPQGPKCQALLAQQLASLEEQEREFRRSSRVDALNAKLMQSPQGAGRYAAGMVSSLLGALGILLLSAAHVGGEWSNRNLKSLLVHDPRRTRFLAGKLGSVWLAGMALLIATWVAVSLIAPRYSAYLPLPGVKVSFASQLTMSLRSAALAALVIAAYAALGVASSVITRGVLPSFFLSASVLLGSAIASKVPGVAVLTPTYWVAGWMHFRSGPAFAHHIWVDTWPQGVPDPSYAAGAVGLVALIAVCGLVSVYRFHQTDMLS